MSKYIRSAGIILLIFIFSAMAKNGQSQNTEEAWDIVQERFNQKINENEVVGGALLFLDENGAEKSSYPGYAELQDQRKVDKNTIFHWASITKTLTSCVTGANFRLMILWPITCLNCEKFIIRTAVWTN